MTRNLAQPVITVRLSFFRRRGRRRCRADFHALGLPCSLALRTPNGALGEQVARDRIVDFIRQCLVPNAIVKIKGGRLA